MLWKSLFSILNPLHNYLAVRYVLDDATQETKEKQYLRRNKKLVMILSSLTNLASFLW